MKRYHEVKITVDMVRRAQSMAKTHGSNSNTIKKRERSRFTGYLGEELVAQFISGLTRANCKDYDFIRWKGSPHSYSIDVKTKERGVLPSDKWSVHIGEYGSHQLCSGQRDRTRMERMGDRVDGQERVLGHRPEGQEG